MTDRYTLTIHNNSTHSGTFCIFQKEPDMNMPDIFTLAWLTKKSHPTSEINFEWEFEYNFVWSKSTTLAPGNHIESSQTWNANLSTLNQVNLDYTEGAYSFNDIRQGSEHGSLSINQSSQVIQHDACVGIGMAGKATLVVPTQPNTEIEFTPKPTYWLIFGDFKEGEVIDTTTVTKNALKLEFNASKKLNVSLNADNTWTIQSG